MSQEQSVITSVRRSWKFVAGCVGFSVGLLVLSCLLPPLFNLSPKLFIISSNSMTPSVPAGSLILTINKSTYHQGDIISFYQPQTYQHQPFSQAIITHRIAKTATLNHQRRYQTKGDANSVLDTGWISHRQIIGKVGFCLPLAGFVVNYLRSRQGYYLLFLIPAGYFYVHLLSNCWEACSVTKADAA